MNEKQQTVLVAVVILVFVLLIVAISSSCRTVQPGYVGVLIRLGAAQDNGLNEGLHFVVPFVSEVTKVDTRVQRAEIKSSAASKDLQTVTATVIVNYHLQKEDVVKLYRQIGITYEQVVIDPGVQEIYKSCTAEFNAEELITKRQIVSEKILDGLSKRLETYGIIVDQVNLVNFDFSEEFNRAIEQKVTAEQQALTEQNRLKKFEFEAEQAVVKAQGEADALLAKAEAEAKSIDLRGEAIKANPMVAILDAITQWDGKLPATFLFGGNQPVTPIFDLSN